MKKWKWTLVGLTLLIALVAYGANIKDNIFNLGDSNNSTNKSINMGAGVLRWDGGSQKMRFSNDSGGVFQDVGGGAGGGSAGINVLVNPDIENGSISGWNSTGPTSLINFVYDRRFSRCVHDFHEINTANFLFGVHICIRLARRVDTKCPLCTKLN